MKISKIVDIQIDIEKSWLISFVYISITMLYSYNGSFSIWTVSSIIIDSLEEYFLVT